MQLVCGFSFPALVVQSGGQWHEQLGDDQRCESFSLHGVVSVLGVHYNCILESDRLFFEGVVPATSRLVKKGKPHSIFLSWRCKWFYGGAFGGTGRLRVELQGCGQVVVGTREEITRL